MKGLIVVGILCWHITHVVGIVVCMKRNTFVTLSTLTALLGSIVLGISFGINPGPDSHATSEQLAVFAHQHFSAVVWGGWLQLMGSLLLVIFAFAIVQLAGATPKLSGILTILGGTLLMVVNASEVTFYMSALFSRPDTAGLLSLDFIHAVQHLYFVLAAPLLFAPLGIVVLTSRVLPRILGYMALCFAAAFALVGAFSFPSLELSAPIQIFGSIQIIWWISAAVVLLVWGRKESGNLSY